MNFGDAFAGVAVAVVAGILGVLGLIVVALAVVLDSRRNPDETGARTTAVYLGVVSFILIWTLVASLTFAVHAITSLIVDEDARSSEAVFEAVPDEITGDFESDDDREEDGPDPQDQVIQDTIQSGLVAIVSGALLVFHIRRRRRLAEATDFAASPAWRADRAFLYLVCAVAVLVIVVAVSVGLYDFFRIAVPGITAEGPQDVERDRAINSILTLLVLVGASGYVFGRAWSAVSGEPEPWQPWRERLRASRARPTPSGPPPPPTGPPAGGVPPPPTR